MLWCVVNEKKEDEYYQSSRAFAPHLCLLRLGAVLLFAAHERVKCRVEGHGREVPACMGVDCVAEYGREIQELERKARQHANRRDAQQPSVGPPPAFDETPSQAERHRDAKDSRAHCGVQSEYACVCVCMCMCTCM